MNLPTARLGQTTSIQIKSGDATTQGLDLIQAAAGMVRRGVYWNQTEQVKGVYDFGGSDPLFAEAEARGLWISATLYSNNALYETGTTGITTEAGRQGFANFAAAAVAHYAGKNVIWEIWNEPNLTSFWHSPSNSAGIADEYTALVKAAAPAMRLADPACFIVAGSISSLWSASFLWFDRCISQGLLTSGINGVSVHPYGFNWPEQVPVTGYSAIRSKMDAAGATTMPIVTTEVGYPLSWIQERQGFTAAEAPPVMGWLFCRQQLVDLMNGIGYSNWYEFRASADFAMVSPTFVPKPSYDIAKVFNQQLKDAKFVSKLSTASEFDYAVVLRDLKGIRKLVVWTTSNQADPIANRRPHPHNVDITIDGSGSVNYVDVNGVAGSYPIANGKISVLFEGGPKYIAIGSHVVS